MDMRDVRVTVKILTPIFLGEDERAARLMIRNAADEFYGTVCGTVRAEHRPNIIVLSTTIGFATQADADEYLHWRNGE